MVHRDFFESKLSCSQRYWKWVESSPETAIYFQQKYQLPELLARLLAQRLERNADVSAFLMPTLKQLMPEPFHLKNMEKAINRTIQAIRNKESIMILGDYDVDGATSTALLKRFFDDCGIPSNFYIPNRIHEGYGVSQKAVEILHEQGCTLLITVDCGTTSVEPITWAQEHGMDVIVIDHHAPDASLPPAFAFVNPHQSGDSSNHQYLCAAGLTFLFVVALRRALFEYQTSLPDIREYLDLVALSTICDMVPLYGLNRAYVVQGLKILQKRTNMGFKALTEKADILGPLSSYHLGFVLGPRINAGGRIGESDLGARLLSTQDPLEAQALAQHLEDLNKERQNMEGVIIEEAIQQIESQGLDQFPILCVASPTWHPGVVGIVASRLKERYHRPCFALAVDGEGIGKGSGRSIPGVDLGRLAHEARREGLLLNGGGHPMAAGITLSMDKLKAFLEFLVSKTPPIDESQRTLPIHGALSASGVSLECLEMLERLEPFGPSNPQPIFLVPHLRLVHVRLVGKGHIKCFFEGEDRHKVSGIAFQAVGTSLGDILLAPSSKKEIFHVLSLLKKNTFQGVTQPELTIKDLMRP